jgi:hypothetical protein
MTKATLQWDRQHRVRAKGYGPARRSPDLDGIFAASEPGVVGAVNALNQAGKVGKIKLIAHPVKTPASSSSRSKHQRSASPGDPQAKL